MFIAALFTIARMWKKPRCPAAAAAAKSLQLCPTLHDPIDCSLPGCDYWKDHVKVKITWFV